MLPPYKEGAATSPLIKMFRDADGTGQSNGTTKASRLTAFTARPGYVDGPAPYCGDYTKKITGP